MNIVRRIAKPRKSGTKTLIVHPGSPKTATSTVQFALRKSEPALNARSVGVVLPHNLRGTRFLGAYLKSYRQDGACPVLPSATQAFLDPWRERFETCILSEETLCHDFMPSTALGTGGIDRAGRAAQLLEQVGRDFDEIKIVLSIRNQLDFLTSTYTHFVHRHREQRTFQEWIAQDIDLERIRWSPAIESFRSVFGDQNVRVVALEEKDSGGMANYACKLFPHLEEAKVKHFIDDEVVHNPSTSQRAVKICRTMNGLVFNVKKSERLNDLIIREFPVKDFGKFKPDWQLSETLASEFRDDYKAALT